MTTFVYCQECGNRWKVIFLFLFSVPLFLIWFNPIRSFNVLRCYLIFLQAYQIEVKILRVSLLAEKLFQFGFYPFFRLLKVCFHCSVIFCFLVLLKMLTEDFLKTFVFMRNRCKNFLCIYLCV